MPVSPTYPLFQLVRLMSIRDDADNGNSPIVTKYAWKEAGEDNLLALYSTNGKYFLTYIISSFKNWVILMVFVVVVHVHLLFPTDVSLNYKDTP